MPGQYEAYIFMLTHKLLPHIVTVISVFSSGILAGPVLAIFIYLCPIMVHIGMRRYNYIIVRVFRYNFISPSYCIIIGAEFQTHIHKFYSVNLKLMICVVHASLILSTRKTVFLGIFTVREVFIVKGCVPAALIMVARSKHIW